MITKPLQNIHFLCPKHIRRKKKHKRTPLHLPTLCVIQIFLFALDSFSYILEISIMDLNTTSLALWSAGIAAFLILSNLVRYFFDWMNYKLPPGPVPFPFIGSFWTVGMSKNRHKMPKVC